VKRWSPLLPRWLRRDAERLYARVLSRWRAILRHLLTRRDPPPKVVEELPLGGIDTRIELSLAEPTPGLVRTLHLLRQARMSPAPRPRRGSTRRLLRVLAPWL